MVRIHRLFLGSLGALMALLGVLIMERLHSFTLDHGFWMLMLGWWVGGEMALFGVSVVAMSVYCSFFDPLRFSRN